MQREISRPLVIKMGKLVSNAKKQNQIVECYKREMIFSKALLEGPSTIDNALYDETSLGRMYRAVFDHSCKTRPDVYNTPPFSPVFSRGHVPDIGTWTTFFDGLVRGCVVRDL